jgi:hypothetical protein
MNVLFQLLAQRFADFPTETQSKLVGRGFWEGRLRRKNGNPRDPFFRKFVDRSAS